MHLRKSLEVEKGITIEPGKKLQHRSGERGRQILFGSRSFAYKDFHLRTYIHTETYLHMNIYTIT
jgi:hypothetical protein